MALSLGSRLIREGSLSGPDSFPRESSEFLAPLTPLQAASWAPIYRWGVGALERKGVFPGAMQP